MKTTLTVLLIINLYGLTSCTIKQHYYINETKNWTNALQYCTTLYYNLSTFTNEIEEQQFLEDAGSQYLRSWVGLYKESEIWKWAGGEVATRISWDTDYHQPDGGNCSSLYLTKKLWDATCTLSYYLFCMNVIEFVVIQQTESWEGAVDYCRDHYDDLASLNSSRKMDYAVSKISGAQTQYVWIGLRFLAGDWFWISGDDLLYQVWSSAKLDCPAGNLRCAALDKNTKTWTPRDCEEKLNFLCVFSEKKRA